MSEAMTALLALSVIFALTIVAQLAPKCRDDVKRVKLYGEVGSVTFRCCPDPTNSTTEICSLRRKSAETW